MRVARVDDLRDQQWQSEVRLQMRLTRMLTRMHGSRGSGNNATELKVSPILAYP